MAIDRNKGVQWIATEPTATVSIFARGLQVANADWSLVYSGPFGPAMVTKLKDWDYGYNYDPNHNLPDDETALFYTSFNEDENLMVLIGAVTFNTETKQFEIQPGYTPNGISLRPDFLQNVTTIYRYVGEGDAPMRMEEIPFEGFNSDCEGFMCTLSFAGTAGPTNPTEPVGPNILLISGSSTGDLGALVGLPETVLPTLRGPNGGASLTDNNELSICLKSVDGPGEVVGPNTTPCFELSGLFAIEINGEIVPYHFSETDLPLFFNATNPYGVQFIKCQETIVCTPQDLRVSNNNILGRTFTAGEWSIDYQLNGGETRTYTVTLADEDWQLGVFRTMMQSILNQEDSGIQWVDSGGGIGHFQFYSWSLTAGNGDAGGPIGGEVDNSRSVKLIRNDNHNADLFWFFFDIFDDLPDGSSVEAISCGFSEFPGF